MLKYLPNALSLLRLALAPVLVVVAWAAGSRPWFLGLFLASLLTDALDGFLARRLKAESDLGRRLDSWGDYVLTGTAVAGICHLWPAVVAAEWPWFVVTLVGCFSIVAYGLVRWRRVLGYHTWLAKGMAVVLPTSVLVLLAGWSAVPFHAAVILQVLCGIEEMAIAFLLPGYSGHIPSGWHAYRRRQDAGATAAPTRL
jgi:phosphatidylglycerophosphate synthase